MRVAKITQQPAECIDYDIDYSEWLGDDDFITHCESTVAPVTEGALPIAVVHYVMEKKVVKLWVFSGLDPEQYKVEITLETNRGRVKQDELIFNVKEV